MPAAQVALPNKVFLPSITVGLTSHKKGLGTHHPEVATDCSLFGAAWRYNWLADIPTTSNCESVPMIYSGIVLRYVETGLLELGGDSHYVMGFNEPDQPGQAGIPPGEAVSLWVRIEEQFPDKLLVSPAPSHVHPGWLAEFYTAYVASEEHPPRLDALAVHCYFADSASGCRAIVEQVIGYAKEWEVPGGVWVTEFAPIVRIESPDPDEARRFIQWLEDNPDVARYAWFPTRLDGSEYWNPNPDDWALLVKGDQITEWGELYRGE